MANNHKIELQFSPGYFLEIYDADTKLSVLKNKITRDAIIYCIAAAGLTLLIYFLSFRYTVISWMLVLGALAFSGTLIYAITVISKHIAWRKGIEKYLLDINKHKIFYLLLTDNYFEFGMDDVIAIKKWNAVNSVLFTDSYIQIILNDNSAHIFPAKTMQPHEFENLKDLIRSRLAHIPGAVSENS